MGYDYVAINIETREEVTFTDEKLYDCGWVITRPNGDKVKIVDIQISSAISAMELIEPWR